MNVNNQATGHPIVDQGTQAEPDTGSSVGQFLKRSVREITLHNIFWDVDDYKDLSNDGKFFMQCRMSAGTTCSVAACCLAGAKSMSCGYLGLLSATAAGYLAGSQMSYMIGKEFFDEFHRLESEASGNAVVTSQPQRNSIWGSDFSSDDEDLEETPPPTYEECVPVNTVRERVNRSDGSSTGAVAD
ncbi:hypothetical protein [Endozoicomonas sp. 8E]|uniref:hypothetical protein n=1 Tax=Endozoicomonas sp. 8E TaxID=3035692 RepID=UPI0029393720|nr:hypothetical protein [Endozoicomonas sp. 8E]WOG26209.1 hypothetical protein P6910_16785 [Endozoicomonas sp. 8E]